MTEQFTPNIGDIVWRDLTVPDADAIQQFYCDVVGWKARPHAMGDYHDYDILPPASEDALTGICYARGSNANVPPVWLIYVWVDDVEQSAENCRAAGGRVLDGPRMMGAQLFAVIEDPAGAKLAIIGADKDREDNG